MYVLTYNFALDETIEDTLFGIRLPYYMAPLFLVNIGIIVLNISLLSKRQMSIAVLIWSLYISFNVLFLSEVIYIDFIRVNLWASSFFASYLLVKRNPQRITSLTWLFIAVFIISTAYFTLSKYTQSSFAQIGLETQSNIVFCVLTVFPWILLQKNKKLTLIFCLITMVAVLFSNKRSAMIIIFLCIIPVVKYYFQYKFKTKHLFILLSAAILFAITFSYINDNYLDNRIGERFSSVSEDGGSGRDRIWLYTWNGYQNSSFINQIFGNGHYKVSKLGQATAAHNDFLEVLFDYGAIGFLIYIFIHLCIFRRLIYLRKKKHPFANSYATMWIIFFVMSLVSILIVQQRYLIYMGVYWGAIEGYLVSQSKTKTRVILSYYL